jgi:deoxyribose-phosphate aldolase
VSDRGAPYSSEWLNAGVPDEQVMFGKARAYEAATLDRTTALTALRSLDLTSLRGDESAEEIADLANRALHPLRGAKAGVPVHAAAVCVHREFVSQAVEVLRGTGVAVAMVAGFPEGAGPLGSRLREIRDAVAAGASEVDVVVPRQILTEGRWEDLYTEVRSYREAAGSLTLKTILSTGTVGSAAAIHRGASVCAMAGTDFLKTSTGLERVNATLTAGVVLASVIRDAAERGIVVGLKPSGGIRTASHAAAWVALARAELGEAWLTPARFRIGASGLLDALVRQITEEPADP